jgi:hypothetical protein
MATVLAPTTGEEIRDLLAHLLAGVAGGDEAKWRRLIGSIERYPTWKHVRFNWGVKPRAMGGERDAIDKAVELVRAEHPYITDPLPAGVNWLR